MPYIADIQSMDDYRNHLHESVNFESGGFTDYASFRDSSDDEQFHRVPKKPTNAPIAKKELQKSLLDSSKIAENVVRGC